MRNYIPKMYKKSVLDVNYEKLKEKNIKYLLFDLDNTILEIGKDIPKKEICTLIKNLKKDFNIYIISNNSSKKRLDKVSQCLQIPYIHFAMKPFSFGFKRIIKKHNLNKSDVCLIGDQIMTDILGGNRFGIYTVLVEPIGEKDLKVTSLNRFLEKRKLKKLEEMKLFKKGEFYE